ncbi:hypothetical protein ACA910_003059 [Epithemia clementina (nom. ined.)]
MASLRHSIRLCLNQFLEEHENEESPVELLRIFQREAWLLQETEQMKDAIRSDPFECLKQWTPSSLNRLLGLLEVTDCHRVQTKSGYCNISVTCQINSDTRMKSKGVINGVELVFSYERQAQHINDRMEPTVQYGISLSKDHGPSEKLLWVEVYTDGHTPSPVQRAINMLEVEDEEWEDMDDDEETEGSKSNRSLRRKEVSEQEVDKMQGGTSGLDAALATAAAENGNTLTNNLDQDGDQEMKEKPDRYLAGIDPDVLANFLRWSHLSREVADDLNAFYFLMTFPFYENEFDLLGYLLEGVFEREDNDDKN